jgi:ferredoxin
MILTTAKSWDEIRSAIKIWDLKKVVVVGCGSCSAQCGTGGTEGVKNIVENLEKDQIIVNSSIVIEEPCDARLSKQELRRIGDAIDQSDGIIIASCGSGAQTLSEITKKPVIVTTNTIMIAQTERIGIYHEKCRACGTCWLNELGGICPITACPKGLLNGPCGGVVEGKCEVGGRSRLCAWILIYDRLKATNHIDLFKKVRLPRKWTLESQRKDSDIRKEMKENYGYC